MNDLTIPDIRARMRELAVELDCSELSFLADAIAASDPTTQLQTEEGL